MSAVGDAIKTLTIIGIVFLLIQNPGIVNTVTSTLVGIISRVFRLGDAKG